MCRDEARARITITTAATPQEEVTSTTFLPIPIKGFHDPINSRSHMILPAEIVEDTDDSGDRLPQVLTIGTSTRVSSIVLQLHDQTKMGAALSPPRPLPLQGRTFAILAKSKPRLDQYPIYAAWPRD